LEEQIFLSDAGNGSERLQRRSPEKDIVLSTLEELLEALEASGKKLEGIGRECQTFWGRKD